MEPCISSGAVLPVLKICEGTRVRRFGRVPRQNEHRAPANSDLSFFFDPRSIAVIGSFRENFFGGYVIVKSLLKAGYKGKIFPINPAYKEVHGLKVYPSLKEVPQKVDLAMV